MSRTSIAWDELVAAATVGTGTRALPSAGYYPTTVTSAGVADDEAVRLLDLAAMESAANAVTVETEPATPVAGALAETGSIVTDRLADLLLQVAAMDREVTRDVLEQVASAGLVLPPAFLPAFLELGRDARLGPALSRAVGERGRWLVGLEPEWSAFLPAVPRHPAERPVDVADWQGGGWEPRPAYLLGLRKVDPAAGRDLLVAGWSTEAADDRPLLLGALEAGLGVDDVPFLEDALRDRRDLVRLRAAGLLVRLSGQLPFGDLPDVGRRMAARARPLVQLVRQGLLRSAALEVVAPEALDETARADAVVENTGGFQKGQRASWLEQILQRAPLSLWENEFHRPPVEIARLPVVGDFARELHPGWRAAVILQRNVEWARALLGAPDAVADALVAAVLPLDERAAYAEGVARSAAPGDGAVVPLLAAVDGPWPGGLATAVLAYVERLLSTAMVRESSPLLQLIARRLPIRRPVLVETIQARLTTEDWADHQARAVGFDHPWRAALTSLSTTLSVRARVDDELRRSTP